MSRNAPTNTIGLLNIQDTDASDHVNLLRGLAAIAVLYGHSRTLFMASLSPSLRVGYMDRLLYILSGYGHTAVIVFFVLSGWLISSSIIRSSRSGSWSWRNYLLARGTRLYVVLIPGLLLTLMWDCFTAIVAHGRIPNSDTAIAIIPNALILQHTSALAFAGNLLFLQTIFVPTLGSNTALWSLANEFWYYLIFPCLWLVCVIPQRQWRQRIFYAIVGIAMLSLVGRSIALYFSIWLMGTSLCFIRPTAALYKPKVRFCAIAITGVLFVLVLLLKLHRHIDENYSLDAVTALTFAALLYCLLHCRSVSRISAYSYAARTASGFSYTVYVVHLPLLIFLRACLTYEIAWAPTFSHWLALAGIIFVVLAYAFALSLVTEAKTDKIRKWLAGRVHQASIH